MKPPQPTCQTCRFWKCSVRPRRDESQEYRVYRPCALGIGREFVGHRTLDRTPRTSPDSRCELHRTQEEPQ